jgi:hypothetical protein
LLPCLLNVAQTPPPTSAKFRLNFIQAATQFRNTIKRAGCLGGYDGGQYEIQRQPAEHDNLLKAAGIEFV